MESKKIVLTILYAEQQRRHETKEQTLGRGRERDDLREQHSVIYITISKADSPREFDEGDAGTQNQCSMTT